MEPVLVHASPDVPRRPHPRIGNRELHSIDVDHLHEAGTMTVTKDTTEEGDQDPTTSPSSGPGATTQAMKERGQAPDRFSTASRTGSRKQWVVLSISRFGSSSSPRGRCCSPSGARGLRAGTGSRLGSPVRASTSPQLDHHRGRAVHRVSRRHRRQPGPNALTALLDKIDMQEERIGETEGNIVTADSGELRDHQRYPHAHHPGRQGHRPDQ